LAIEELFDRAGELQIVDVRELSEWRAGHIPGSVHVPYHDIDALPDGIDPALPVAVVCASGQRAAVAASLLARFGAARVVHVVGGGVGTWERAGHPMELCGCWFGPSGRTAALRASSWWGWRRCVRGLRAWGVLCFASNGWTE
jgi:rhodanese-related sulfurtransferase